MAKGDAAAIAKATSIHTTASALLDLTARVVKSARVDEVLKARGLLGVRGRLRITASGNAAHTSTSALGRPHQPSNVTHAPGPLPCALPRVLPGGNNWLVPEEDNEQERGHADMDEAAVAPCPASGRSKAAPIKFEGELAHLNLLSKEDQRKVRRQMAQQRRREAESSSRADEASKRAAKPKADPSKHKKQRKQDQDYKQRKRDREAAGCD